MDETYNGFNFFHFGLAVSDIDDWLRPLQDLFESEESTRRVVDHEYLGRLVGSEGITAEIAMFPFSDSQFIELIKWKNSAESLIKPLSLCERNTAHLCIYVEKIEDLFERAQSISGIQVVSTEVVLVPTGPNQGAKVFFLSINQTLFLELFQKAH